MVYKLDGTMHDPHKEQYNFNIYVGLLQDNARELKPVNSDVFVGVSPRKGLARFYISAINNK